MDELVVEIAALYKNMEDCLSSIKWKPTRFLNQQFGYLSLDQKVCVLEAMKGKPNCQNIKDSCFRTIVSHIKELKNVKSVNVAKEKLAKNEEEDLVPTKDFPFELELAITSYKLIINTIVKISNGERTYTLHITQEKKEPGTVHNDLAKQLNSKFNIDWIEYEEPRNHVSKITIFYEIRDKELLWKVYPLSLGYVAMSDSKVRARMFGPDAALIQTEEFAAKWKEMSDLSEVQRQRFKTTIKSRATEPPCHHENHILENMHPKQLTLGYAYMEKKYFSVKDKNQIIALLNADSTKAKFIIGVHNGTANGIGFVPEDDEPTAELLRANFLQKNLFPTPCWDVIITVYSLTYSHPKNWGDVNCLLFHRLLTEQEIHCALIYFKGIACWRSMDEGHQLLVPSGRLVYLDDSFRDSLLKEHKKEFSEDFLDNLANIKNYSTVPSTSFDEVKERVVVEYKMIQSEANKRLYVEESEFRVPVAVDETSCIMDPFNVWLRLTSTKVNIQTKNKLQDPLWKIVIPAKEKEVEEEKKDRKRIIRLVRSFCDSDISNVVQTIGEDDIYCGVVIVLILDKNTRQLVKEYCQNVNGPIRFVLLIPFLYLKSYNVHQMDEQSRSLSCYIGKLSAAIQDLWTSNNVATLELLLFSNELFPDLNKGYISPFTLYREYPEVTEEEEKDYFTKWTLSALPLPAVSSIVVSHLLQTQPTILLLQNVKNRLRQLKAQKNIRFCSFPLYKPLDGCGATSTLQILQKELDSESYLHVISGCISKKDLKSLPALLQTEMENSPRQSEILVLLVDDISQSLYQKLIIVLQNIESLSICLICVVKGHSTENFCINPLLSDEDLDSFATVYKRFFDTDKAKAAVDSVLDRVKRFPDELCNRHLYVMALAASTGKYVHPHKMVDEIYSRLLQPVKTLVEHLAFVIYFATFSSPFAAGDVQKMNAALAKEDHPFWELFGEKKGKLKFKFPFFAQIIMLKCLTFETVETEEQLSLSSLKDSLIGSLEYFCKNSAINTGDFKETLIFELLCNKGDQKFSRFVHLLLAYGPIHSTKRLDPDQQWQDRTSVMDDIVKSISELVPNQKKHLLLVQARFYRSKFEDKKEKIPNPELENQWWPPVYHIWGF